MPNGNDNLDEFDELLRAAAEYEQRFEPKGTGAQPARGLVVLTCMDTRIDPLPMFGLSVGDAHVLRNAGGRATDDAIRSLIVSANWLGTRRILVVHHTRCGMLGQSDLAMRARVREATGHDPADIDFHPIGNLEQSVRDDVRFLRQCEFLPDGVSVRGAIYDVDTGALTPVDGVDQAVTPKRSSP